MIRYKVIVSIAVLACIGSVVVFGQETASVQIKTFDQQLKPLPEIYLSINGGAFISIGSRATAFVEISRTDLPPRSITVRNEKLEAASWNYSKGVLEVIIRKKNFRVLSFYLRSTDDRPLPERSVIYAGKDTVRVTSGSAGDFKIPVGNSDPLPSKMQFSIEGFRVDRIYYSEGENIVSVVPEEKPVAKQDGALVNSSGLGNFDLRNLDSIQSLTVFYSVFKNFPFSRLDEDTRKKIDMKLYSLMRQAQEEEIASPGLMLNRISDSTFVSDDIRFLLEQARDEQQALTDLRESFNGKISLINDKLSGGIGSLSPEEREILRQDIRILEAVLKENESRFYRNQEDYHNVLYSIKEKFFDVRELEARLSSSEAQREQDRADYRRKIFTIFFVTLGFGVVIVLLIHFSRKLKRKKEELVVANSEIRRINENLESLVYQRTVMLTNAHKELDTFFYKASHDLQGPLCSIIGLCNIAKQTVDPDSIEIVQRTYRTALAMDRMLRKLKVMSEINQPSDPSRVVLKTELQLIEQDFRQIISERNISFNIDCDENIVFPTHRDLLYTTLSNLIDNALFFAGLKAGNQPEVSIRARLQVDSVQITIIDNGIGVPLNLREQIWDMFFIGNEKSPGNGLGLYIVRKCVQAMHGYISLESEEDRYTKIILIIPAGGAVVSTMPALSTSKSHSDCAETTL